MTRSGGCRGLAGRPNTAGAISPAVIIGVMLMVVVVIAFVVFMERALRKIYIQYPRRQVGMKVYGGESSHLPVKVNPAGVIPAMPAGSSPGCVIRSMMSPPVVAGFEQAAGLAARPVPPNRR